MATVVPTIVCRAGDLSAVLAESVRRVEHRQEQQRLAYHAKLDDALGYRWVPTEAGEDALRERLVADEEPRTSSEYDTRGGL